MKITNYTKSNKLVRIISVKIIQILISFLLTPSHLKKARSQSNNGVLGPTNDIHIRYNPQVFKLKGVWTPLESQCFQ